MADKKAFLGEGGSHGETRGCARAGTVSQAGNSFTTDSSGSGANAARAAGSADNSARGARAAKDTAPANFFTPGSPSPSPYLYDVEPRLTLTNWADEWVELQAARKKPDDPAYWDERSKTFHKVSKSGYSDDFIRMLALERGDSVFDMGCGNGAISIPLAASGVQVVAADFSAGMLESLKAQAAELGCAQNINAVQVSWEGDWQAAGITPGSVDVALASRSIVTADMRDSLVRLSRVARKKCAVTLPTGSSPRSDAAILKAIGLQPRLRSDYLYAFMILAQLGYLPRIDYIPSTRFDSWDTTDDAYASLKKMIDDVAADILPAQDVEGGLARLREWLRDNLIENPNAGAQTDFGDVQGRYILKNHRKITWAFISWDV